MTSKEALLEFENENRIVINKEAYQIAADSIRKQIPKKIIYVHPVEEDDIDYMCPSCRCGTVLDAYGNIPCYCHYCGQSIYLEGGTE